MTEAAETENVEEKGLFERIGDYKIRDVLGFNTTVARVLGYGLEAVGVVAIGSTVVAGSFYAGNLYGSKNAESELTEKLQADGRIIPAEACLRYKADSEKKQEMITASGSCGSAASDLELTVAEQAAGGRSVVLVSNEYKVVQQPGSGFELYQQTPSSWNALSNARTSAVAVPVVTEPAESPQ